MTYSLVCAVSAGDIDTTHLRIEGALRNIGKEKDSIFLLNGFNTNNEHDVDFQGQNWRDDFRLRDIYLELEKFNPFVVYAKNTVENGTALRRVKNYSGYDLSQRNALTVTSETHLRRLKRIFWHVFPKEEYDFLNFEKVREPNKKLKIVRTLSECLEFPVMEILLAGIKRGDNNINKIYEERRYSGKIGKTLSSLKSIIL